LKKGIITQAEMIDLYTQYVKANNYGRPSQSKFVHLVLEKHLTRINKKEKNDGYTLMTKEERKLLKYNNVLKIDDEIKE
jgi:hypothetical protein